MFSSHAKLTLFCCKRSSSLQLAGGVAATCQGIFPQALKILVARFPHQVLQQEPHGQAQIH